MEILVLKGHKKGFTLLEVLIVIAIIGILVTLGVVSYTSAQQKSRDSRRRSDLKAIQNALEQLYADSATASYIAGCSNISTTYLPAGLPKDPKTNANYPVLNCAATGYCICATLESGQGNSDGTINALTGSCNSFNASTYYCVSSLQ